jgi:hypothetical protein
VHDDSGREPKIILRVTEESGLQEIALKSPSDYVKKTVVNTAAQSVREGRI